MVRLKLKSETHSRRQGGFFLPGLAIGVVLVSLIVGGILVRYAQQEATARGDERAKLVGSRLAAIDDAVKTYSTSYFTQIQRQQQVERNGHTVPASRVRTPTTDDLFRMDLLSEQHAAAFVYNGRAIGFDVRLAVPSSGCTIPNCNVTALVASTEPMVDLQNQNEVDLRRATIAAGVAGTGRAGISLPESPGMFVSVDSINIGANVTGIAGLIAITNGYDSRGFLEFARRDGSLPMTGDINMQDDSGVRHSIRNAKDMATETLTASGRIKTGEYLQFTGAKVLEDTACPEEGLGAPGFGGVILSCQAGKWKKSGGSGGAITDMCQWGTYGAISDGQCEAMCGGTAPGRWRVLSHWDMDSGGGGGLRSLTTPGYGIQAAGSGQAVLCVKVDS
ncbi:MAG: hypothetical protein RSC68_11240 [Acinetobacter sp.]